MPAIREQLLAVQAENFLTDYEARRMSPNTLRAYRGDLASFIDPLDEEMLVGQVDQKMVRRYLAKLHESKAATSTIHRKLAAVKSFCRWMGFEELLSGFEKIDAIRGPQRELKRPDVPSEAAMQKLLSGRIPGKSPERDRLILELLYSSGIREAELCNINISDFRENDVLLIRGKGNKERQVLFGEYAQRALAAWLPVRKKLLWETGIFTEALLFSVGIRLSERLDVRNIRRIIAKIAEANGLPSWNPHLFRHAFASHLHDHEAPLQAISTLLGHENLSTTQHYTFVSVGRMQTVYRRAHPHAGE